jgi:hypothetical protein
MIKDYEYYAFRIGIVFYSTPCELKIGIFHSNFEPAWCIQLGKILLRIYYGKRRVKMTNQKLTWKQITVATLICSMIPMVIIVSLLIYLFLGEVR